MCICIYKMCVCIYIHTHTLNIYAGQEATELDMEQQTGSK